MNVNINQGPNGVVGYVGDHGTAQMNYTACVLEYFFSQNQKIFVSSNHSRLFIYNFFVAF